MDKVVYIVAELEMANIELANIIETIGFDNVCNEVFAEFGDCETMAWSKIIDFIKEVAYEN